MKDGRIYLKVKIKSLAAEARIIRDETRRAPKELRSGLSAHRRGTVREAARNTLLAYAFIRGQAYRDVEPTSDRAPNWKEVARMVRQYGLLWEPTHPYPSWESAKRDEAARLDQWMKESARERVRSSA